ncbi:MAG: oligosaccharide flippase family protein [Gammaproteobacteria bacterium]|nr:oligosaccharide flippase family protein [Gammaproteobacteria bacterium]
MSLKLNVAANYGSQIYTTLIGIILVPLYLQRMGPESFGLVGFFSMLQAWFSILDLGLTPTIARESARYFGGALPPQDYRRLCGVLSTIFAAVALVGGGLLVAIAPVVASDWLHLNNLPTSDVVFSLQIMGLTVAMRWMGGLYRGIVSGAERLTWLSSFNALIATLRFAAVFVSMGVWGYTPMVFFMHQLVVAALELGMLYLKSARLLPRLKYPEQSNSSSFSMLAPLLKFSLTIAFTSSVWVFVTQSDKLVLSGILPLSEYGLFTLAVMVSGGITIVTGPVSTVLLPRLARLYAEGNHDEIIRLYNVFAQLVGVISISLATTFVCGAESLLFAWTGDQYVSSAAAPVVRLYAVGNGMLALGAFPFYLQYARGNLRYHLIGNVVLTVLLIPSIMLAAFLAGGEGAGWVWVGMNIIYLFGWVAYIHGKLEPGLHVKWLCRNVLAILLPTALMGILLSTYFDVAPVSRWQAVVHISFVFFACAITAFLASSDGRNRLLRCRLSVRKDREKSA